MTNQPHEFKPSSSLIALEAIERDLGHLIAGLKEDQFHATTAAGGWSVAYCIEHLVLSGHAFLPKWDLALKNASARSLYRTGPMSYRWWHRLILAGIEPPYRIKTKTKWAFTPCSRQSIEETLRRFFSMHREVRHRIELSVGVDAERARVQSPFVSWISYPLGLSFDLALAHERRHLWQAWRVRRQFASGHGEPAGPETKHASPEGHLRYTVESTPYQHMKR